MLKLISRLDDLDLYTDTDTDLWFHRLTELLSEQRGATKENVTRKQARTAGEKEESEEEEAGSDSEDEDDDDIPYNPKNLPLGWDGKVSLNSSNHCD